MNWIVFAYSLSTKSSSPRVALWRRLHRLGAILAAGGLYVLPARDECVEAFHWLAREIHQVRGEAVVLHVERFEGLSDQELVGFFNQARSEEYAELDAHIASLEKHKPKARAQLQDAIEKLRKQYAEIARVDYFGCPEGTRVAARLAALALALAPDRPPAPRVASVSASAYARKTWVTRPRPHVDRLACAWLIHRFIDPNAVIRYSPQPSPGQVAFDMEQGGEFGHQGNLCTFETMCRAFGLDDAGLRTLAEIVHEIDLRDGQFVRPATIGVEAVLDGWHRANLTDADLEAHGRALFEGLYQHFSKDHTKKVIPSTRRVGKSKGSGKPG